MGAPARTVDLSRLGEMISTPVLLVACDYDGTLAPIVDDPELARPTGESIASLRALAALPDTHVAVISGRALGDLATLSRLPAEVHLVGSHGSEFDPGFAARLPSEARGRTNAIQHQVDQIAITIPGSRVEHKPAGAAFHYRNVDSELIATVVEAILSGPGSLPGVHVKHGKFVVDISAVATDKGVALNRIRQLVGATAALFVGDDVTDESAFATLVGPDVSIKVGPGETTALARLDNPDAVARFLANLFLARRAWLEGDDAPPIEHHTLLSDQRTLALLTPDARVTWLCFPRADSPSVFAEILGGPTAGSFAVRPEPNVAPFGQRYVGDSFVVETQWPSFNVTDYLDTSNGLPFQPAGLTHLVRVIEGDGPVVIEFAPRLDYGRAPTPLETCDDGVSVRGSPHSLRLVAPNLHWVIDTDGQHERATARVELLPGHPIVLELRLGGHGADEHQMPELVRRRATSEYWSNWAGALQVPSVVPTMVRRSALLLKGLCHQPTGAILAAATTSLPESIGGTRNWDYRYCWARDAAIAADSLARLGSNDEGLAFVDWLADRLSALDSADSLRPLYPLSGDEFLPEAVIPTLHGYRGSRPVRIGNLAEHQLQLDMFGPIIQLVHRLERSGAEITDRHWDLVRSVVDAVARRWGEPDNGIWEVRAAPRHHVHSKMMCWVALDRGISLAVNTGRPAPLEWSQAASAASADILKFGWNPRLGSFSSAYDDENVDASLLNVALIGLIPPDDPRVSATVSTIERTLRRGPVVRRYRFDDGLPGREGGFLLCTAWLIEAMIAVGRTEDAHELFAQYVDLAGPTGLLSEEYDPETRTALGNIPQAYSHAGLINAAIALGAVEPPRGHRFTTDQ